MKLFKRLVYHICIFLPTNSYNLNVLEPSTYTFRNYGEQFSINNISYREASNYDNTTSLFVINLKRGNYQVTNPPYYSTTVDTISSNTTNLNRIITKNTQVLIDKIKLMNKDPDLLWVAGRVSSLPFPSNNKIIPPTYYLIINNKTMVKEQTSSFSFFLQVPIEVGLVDIQVIGTSVNNNWCSCPSIGNGFVLSHGLWAWISPDSNKKVTDNPNITLFSDKLSTNDIMINFNDNSIKNLLKGLFSTFMLITQNKVK